jgi:hypothetical protein
VVDEEETWPWTDHTTPKRPRDHRNRPERKNLTDKEGGRQRSLTGNKGYGTTSGKEREHV